MLATDRLYFAEKGEIGDLAASFMHEHYQGKERENFFHPSFVLSDSADNVLHRRTKQWVEIVSCRSRVLFHPNQKMYRLAKFDSLWLVQQNRATKCYCVYCVYCV